MVIDSSRLERVSGVEAIRTEMIVSCDAERPKVKMGLDLLRVLFWKKTNRRKVTWCQESVTSSVSAGWTKGVSK
jgi:hypothetical protein